MRFQILGPTVALDEDGAPVTLGGPRGRALLTLLALDAGRIVSAGRLVDGMYGPHPPEGTANALQSQVSRLRRALGRDLVEFHPSGYRLVADRDDVDAGRFERLAAEGRGALASGDAARAATLLREALALWRGTPLADAPHAAAAAAALEELRLAATEDRVQADLELGGHREVVAELRGLTAAHPLRERLRAQLMRALYGAGRQAEALAVYAEARRVLGEELGVDPGPELAAAHLAVLRADGPEGLRSGLDGARRSAGPGAGAGVRVDGPAQAPGGAAVDAGPGRLRQGVRAQLTSFVGRDEELAQVGARLRDSRLVTLIGPGGAGKTRLALEAAERARGDVCVVQLASVATASPALGAAGGAASGPAAGGDVVAEVVLGALGVRETVITGLGRPAVGPNARLVTALADRALLLVLDNCEHLVGPVAVLADQLLAACPSLRVLATSREALGITGESILPVAPLRLPPPDAPDPLAYPSVRLFADRAAAVRASFTVTGENAGRVAEVCRALDGLPLAIELAAARLSTLTLEDVADRLGDRFRLLARGSRTALPRHQTLHAVVAWSWDLLDEDEQRMARRLTVFAGGARPEAAERVCGLPEEVLFSLAEKSLVEVVDGRFRMLQTIRAFCAERLDEAGETERTRAAHLAYYVELAEEADARLRSADQLGWLARLDEESGDLDAAARWATESGRLEAALRLLARCAYYWWLRAHRGASATLAAALLPRLGDAAAGGSEIPDGLEEEYAMCVLVAAWAGEADEGLRARLETLPAVLPPTRVPRRLEFLMMLRSAFTGPPDDYDGLLLLYEAMSDLAPWPRALSLTGAGFMLQLQDRVDEARARFEEGLAAFRAIGERWGMVLALSGLAALAYGRGEYREAGRLAGEALEKAVELGATAEIAEALCVRGDCRLRLSDVEGAESDYRAAEEQGRRGGSMESLARAHAGLGEAALVRGDVAAARSWLLRARAECQEGWYSADEIRARVLADLAELDARTGGADGGGAVSGR
ncbi:AfsR/SARP family transcriptional regulator [Nonomuraea pusilla]|uniref:Predicted ATPase n=1 Tax=Nonomuraea pusilla TaxID=46177 RepID=A0A1H7W0K6_9ACTN|nr:BTAD domain-containing putative transcriptional regulator [Nonomuraea pusilla]SEM14578.1 Predicted ATPase [Nonomuraea pusilla]